MWPFRFTAIALLCWLANSIPAAGQTPEAPKEMPQETVRIMTYNIRYLNDRDGEDVWQHRKSAVIQTVGQNDVVGLQEVVWQQFQEIRGGTSGFGWYGVGRDDGQEQGEAVPIGWRTNAFKKVDAGTFWLSPTPQVVGSKGWDAALPRIASWVHLERRSSTSATEPHNWWILNTHFDHRGRKAREEAGKQIRSWVRALAGKHKSACIVVLGDLNATLDSRPLNALLENQVSEAQSEQAQTLPLRDARSSAAHPDPGPNSTWNGFRQIEAGRRIDHILVGATVQVESVVTLNPKTKAGRFASDHLPVQALLVPGNTNTANTTDRN